MTFAETQPLPTYLFAFVAGKFSMETAVRDGRELRMFHRETDAAKVARNRDAIFDLHAGALDWLQQYTARSPIRSASSTSSSSHRFSSAAWSIPAPILYNASSLLLDESATQTQKLDRASVIAHETSHMWFGDLVTMRWFNDVWMKEVFANFMAAKIVNPSFPELNHELRFLLDALSDGLPGGSHGRHESDPAAAGESQRGRPALRADHLSEGADRHASAGDDARRRPDCVTACASTCSSTRFGNATWLDLVRLLDARTPTNLGGLEPRLGGGARPSAIRARDERGLARPRLQR